MRESVYDWCNSKKAILLGSDSETLDIIPVTNINEIVAHYCVVPLVSSGTSLDRVAALRRILVLFMGLEIELGGAPLLPRFKPQLSVKGFSADFPQC